VAAGTRSSTRITTSRTLPSMLDELDRVVTGLIDRLRNAKEDYQVAEAVLLLQQKDVRLNLPHREVLTELVDEIGPLREELGDLVELLAVLDDEPLIVLHRPSATGYALTISGIAGNSELAELLGATLRDHGVSGQFTMVDHTGSWIGAEGRPADIPELDGRRVILLEPRPYGQSWRIDRDFPQMHPEMRLDQVLPDAEVARLLLRAAGL
jgi:hypothetical protein